jgi:fluoroquinolone transport system permease protein
MRTLFRTIGWDLKLLVRYNILTVAIIIAIVYTALFLILNLKGNDEILIAVIFSDPTFMGFLFIGVLVLFEKSSNTLQALVVTPVKIWQYLFSKAISLTLVALLICFAMVFVGHGFHFNYLYFFLATSLSSVFFIFIGFIGVSKVKTFNQYILVIPLFLAPLSVPYLGLFDVSNSWWLYLIPTQASFLLFEASFEKMSFLKIIYSIVYISVSIVVAFYISKQLFQKHLIKGE